MKRLSPILSRIEQAQVMSEEDARALIDAVGKNLRPNEAKALDDLRAKLDSKQIDYIGNAADKLSEYVGVMSWPYGRSQSLGETVLQTVLMPINYASHMLPTVPAVVIGGVTTVALSPVTAMLGLACGVAHLLQD